MTTILYSHTTETGRELVVNRQTSGAVEVWITEGDPVTRAIHATLPDTPAERMRLAAAILAEDLPEAIIDSEYGDICSGGLAVDKNATQQEIVNFWKVTLARIAIALHMDAQSAARDAAKAEAEQRDAEQVDAEAERLYLTWQTVEYPNQRPVAFEVLAAQDAWRAVARDSLARQNGVTE